MFAEILSEGLGENRFQFYVISAGPREVVCSALEGIAPPENVFGTELEFDPETGDIRELFALYGLALQDWDKVHTDWITSHN